MAVVCSVCEKEFSSKASLASHRSRYHSKSLHDKGSNDNLESIDDISAQSMEGDPAELSDASTIRYRKHSKRKPFDYRQEVMSNGDASSGDESHQSSENHDSGDESDSTVDFGPERDALGSIHPDKKRARNIIDIIRKALKTPTDHFDATEAVSFQEATKSKVPNPFENTQLANNQMYFLYVLYKIPDGHLTELTKFVNENFKTVTEIWQLLFKEAQSKVSI